MRGGTKCSAGWHKLVDGGYVCGRYGTLEFDAACRITTFREKAGRTEGFINGGVYLMDRGVLAAIEPGENISIETDTFPALAAAGQMRQQDKRSHVHQQ